MYLKILLALRDEALSSGQIYVAEIATGVLCFFIFSCLRFALRCNATGRVRHQCAIFQKTVFAITMPIDTVV